MIKKALFLAVVVLASSFVRVAIADGNSVPGICAFDDATCEIGADKPN